jgi:dolichyl-phosphate-mannose-protein mannosyltransferase
METRAPANAARWLTALAITVVALVPRLIGLDNTVTVDEPLWVTRATAFYDGLGSGHLSRTYQSSHPGVTTMWLAGAGLKTLPKGEGAVDPYRRARVPFAVATSIMIGCVFILARRLFGALPGAVAAMLLALDPFLLHHSRVAHTDAVVALAMLLGILAFLGAVRSGHGHAGAGVFAGLALLTKGTSLVIVPFLLGALIFRATGSFRAAFSKESLGRLWRHPGARRFALAAAATFVVLWPAVWVRPWDALAAPFLSAGRGAVLAQERNFFFGETPRNPGPMFYPVAMAYRMTPVTLVLAGWAIGSLWRRRDTVEDRDLRTLVWFAVLFVLLLTPGAKKLDRFALPAIVALTTAGGVLLGRAIGRVKTKAVAAGAIVVALAAQTTPGLALAPNSLGAFNWMLGGPPAARHVILAGGGEGLGEAGAILNRLGATSVATTRRTGLSEVFEGRVVGIQEGPADYVLFYISSVQTRVAPALWERYRHLKPVATVRIGGITKVWIWRAAFPPHVSGTPLLPAPS